VTSGIMKPPVEINRQSDPRDTVELLLSAIADAIADRLDQRQDTRRRLLKMEQACAYLDASEDTLQRLVAAKKLTPVRVDRHVRFDIRELDALVEEAKKQRRGND
jgi:excisionase family DNA binding protein